MLQLYQDFTPSWHSEGSTVLGRWLPADAARARAGAAGGAMPKAARTRLWKAGSASLATASSSLHPRLAILS